MARPSTLHDSIVDDLGRKLAGGWIVAGCSLPREDELAQAYGVSRTVVREVARTLQALGLVVTGPRIGSRVQPLKQWRLLDPRVMNWIVEADLAGRLTRDLLELRSMIEPTAAALAAERASAADIAGIRAAVAAMAAATDKAAHLDADFQFHERVLEASGNMLLTQLEPVLHAVLHASFRLSMEDEDRARASVAIHGEVAEAIAAHRPDAARAAMQSLIRVAERDIAHSRMLAAGDDRRNETIIEGNDPHGASREAADTGP